LADTSHATIKKLNCLPGSASWYNVSGRFLFVGLKEISPTSSCIGHMAFFWNTVEMLCRKRLFPIHDFNSNSFLTIEFPSGFFTFENIPGPIPGASGFSFWDLLIADPGMQGEPKPLRSRVRDSDPFADYHMIQSRHPTPTPTDQRQFLYNALCGAVQED
jgi:hypothetical protein